MSSINKEPNSNTADLDGGSERGGVFSVARSNTAPPFEKKESVLHEMAEFVEIFVVFPRGKLYIENGQSDNPMSGCSPLWGWFRLHQKATGRRPVDRRVVSRLSITHKNNKGADPQPP